MEKPIPSPWIFIANEQSGVSADRLIIDGDVVIPDESNYLINPGHPDFGRLRIGASKQFVFDPRLAKR